MTLSRVFLGKFCLFEGFGDNGKSLGEHERKKSGRAFDPESRSCCSLPNLSDIQDPMV